MNIRGIVLVAAIAGLLAACASDKSTPTTYEELLGLVPDTPEIRSSVFITDYALIRELFDIPLPGPGADEKAMEEYYTYAPPLPWEEGLPDIRGVATTAFLSDGYSQWRNLFYEQYQGLHRQYLGFDIRNEDQTLVAGVPPRQLEVLRGRFDPEAFDRALSACSGECTPPDARGEYKGVTFSSWGEDFAIDLRRILAPPAFDQFGRGGRIAVQDEYVFRTLATDDMHSMIDASLDERPSLADREDYRLLAQGMSELGAYGMFLTDQTQDDTAVLEALLQGGGEDVRGAVQSMLEGEVKLRRYEVFATGVGKDDIGAYTALVLVHADAGSATDNVLLLRRRIEQAESLWARRPWTDYFDAGGMEVAAKGRVLLAKLRPTQGRPPTWLEWVFQRDPLLLHEGEAASGPSPVGSPTSKPTPSSSTPTATLVPRPAPTATPVPRPAPTATPVPRPAPEATLVPRPAPTVAPTMPTPLPPTSTPVPTVAPVTPTPLPPTSTLVPTPPRLQPMGVNRAFPNLTFQRLTNLVQPDDGLGHFFVTEQPGRVKVFPNDQQAAQANVFLDITDRVNEGNNEEGLLGLAFDSNYKSNGYFYVYYSAANPRRSVVSRFSVSQADPNLADAGSELIIMEVAQPFGNHNGGQLAFGPDGYLYVGLGDGGSGGDPRGNGQNIATLLGSIVRIDVSRGSGETNYIVPSDNPFVGTDGAREEIWAYGLRNPWRFSFDSGTGLLWAGDVGQNDWEEVDIIKKGSNYGWNTMEGAHCFSPSTGCNTNGLELPVVEYGQNVGCSITGGYVYRGADTPSLQGAYVYGDFCSGKIWGLRYSGGIITEHILLADSGLFITSFGQDQDGNLYILSRNNGIYQLVASGE